VRSYIFMPPVMLVTGGSAPCEQAGMVTIRTISCDEERCVWEGIQRTGMQGAFLAAGSGGLHKQKTDSTVSNRGLTVL